MVDSAGAQASSERAVSLHLPDEALGKINAGPA